MRRRLASIFLALLVVSSGAVAPVSAQSMTDSQCEGIAAWIQNAVVLGLTGTASDACSPTNDKIEEMKQSDANQTKVDIYASASAEAATGETFRSVNTNYLQDSESAAWMKIQIAVAEAYQNGSSEL